MMMLTTKTTTMRSYRRDARIGEARLRIREHRARLLNRRCAGDRANAYQFEFKCEGGIDCNLPAHVGLRNEWTGSRGIPGWTKMQTKTKTRTCFEREEEWDGKEERRGV